MRPWKWNAAQSFQWLERRNKQGGRADRVLFMHLPRQGEIYTDPLIRSERQRAAEEGRYTRNGASIISSILVVINAKQHGDAVKWRGAGWQPAPAGSAEHKRLTDRRDSRIRRADGWCHSVGAKARSRRKRLVLRQTEAASTFASR